MNRSADTVLPVSKVPRAKKSPTVSVVGERGPPAEAETARQERRGSTFAVLVESLASTSRLGPRLKFGAQA